MLLFHRDDASKVLVDSSVWIDFTRGKPSAAPLAGLLAENRVVCHIYVEAELRAGQMHIDRQDFFSLMARLVYAPVVPFDELFSLIEHRKLYARGVSFVDVALIMSAMVIGAKLWSHDKNLVNLALELDTY